MHVKYPADLLSGWLWRSWNSSWLSFVSFLLLFCCCFLSAFVPGHVHRWVCICRRLCFGLLLCMLLAGVVRKYSPTRHFRAISVFWFWLMLARSLRGSLWRLTETDILFYRPDVMGTLSSDVCFTHSSVDQPDLWSHRHGILLAFGYFQLEMQGRMQLEISQEYVWTSLDVDDFYLVYVVTSISREVIF